MLRAIAEILQAAGLVGSVWAEQMEQRGELVKLFREYYDGQHRLKLTKEMRLMMQVDDDRLDRYNDNYCEMVVDAMADRLTVDTVEALIEGDGENPAQTWVEAIMQGNRMDGLQIGVHEAVLRDGETYLMVGYDDDGGTVLAHELAWDGDTGVMVVYDRQGKQIVAGVKVWYEGDLKRANIYYPNSTLKYAVDGEEMKLVAEDSTERGGRAPGVPIVRFANKGKGTSELMNVIPLQDSLNRTLVSMVMSAELTAFSVMFAKGWKPPSGITPGMVLHSMVAGEDGNAIVTDDPEQASAYAALNDAYSLERIEGGSLQELISQADFLINQIAMVSSTPIPAQMGTGAQSGEGLKQRDVRLLGKVRRGQVQLGNAWEDVFTLAHWQQELFAAQKPPVVTGWYARWKTAEIRNDADIRETAKLLQEWGYEREALRVLSQSSIVNYSDDDIARLMQEKQADASAALGAAVGNLDGFGQFSF